jgi:hypothetical protein
MVVEQIDLVHVQDASVGLGKETWLKRLDTLSKSLLDIDSSANPVLSGTKGEIDHGNLHMVQSCDGSVRQGERVRWGMFHLHGAHGEVLSLLEPLPDLGRHELRVIRVAVEGILGHHPHLREEVSKGSDRGGLSSATVSHNHDASDLGVDNVEDEGELHLLLADDGCEGEHRAGST